MGYSPQPPSRYCVPPFPVRRRFIMARRSRCVHHPALPLCFHRLRISLFSSSTRSSFPCAFERSLATSTAGSALSCHFPFHNSIFADNFLTYTSAILSSSPIPFFPADSLFFFHAFDRHLATSPAGYAPSYHFPFHHSSSAYLYDTILP